ncbi:MAG TPA: hypothetical protein DEA16_03185 [Opitutae bacterium]|jgi:hypothetical protein|nr:hypothetical protein [Opitutae bacterium]HBR67143.1 hypothetical protein [Opitutae bacterium]
MRINKTLLCAKILITLANLTFAQTVILNFNSAQIPTSGGNLFLLGSGTGSTNAFLSDRFENYNSTQFEIQSIPTFGTLTVTAATSGTGFLNVTTTGLGEGGSGINNSNEFISFTFSEDIEITFLDFNAITGTESVELLIEANSLGTFLNDTVVENIADFTAPSNITASISLAQGEAFIMKHVSGAYDLERIGFTVVPEPSTYALLFGCCALALAMIRRR